MEKENKKSRLLILKMPKVWEKIKNPFKKKDKHDDEKSSEKKNKKRKGAEEADKRKK